MQNPKLIQTPEIHRLRGYLDALQDLTIAGDHPSLFDIFACDLPQSDFEITELFAGIYPYLLEPKVDLREASLSSMMGNINRALTLATSVYDSKSPYWQAKGYASQYNLAGFWEQVKGCIDYEGASIFEYYDSEEADAYWKFTYAICNKQQGRLVILYGRASN
jgi:hypothetical protein